MRTFSLLCVLTAPRLSSAITPLASNNVFAKRQISPASTLLVDFQVTEPILTPSGLSDQYGCIYTKVLMEHDFAYSYGAPFVGKNAQPVIGARLTSTLIQELIHHLLVHSTG